MNKVTLEAGRGEIFYDAHMHAYNLSHPSIGAMIIRILSSLGYGHGRQKIPKWMSKIIQYIWQKRMIFLTLVASLIIVILLTIFYFVGYLFVKLVDWSWWTVLPVGLAIGMLCFYYVKQISKNVRGFLQNISKVLNLLFVMDYSIGEYFLQIERELVENKGLESGIGLLDKDYKKFALSPLMMDFSGEKNYLGNFFGIKNQERIEEELFFDLPNYKPKNKPIIEQEFDLFKGIKDYYDESPHGLLEFYPFRGIEFNELIDEKQLDELMACHFEGLEKDGATRKKRIAEGVRQFPHNTTYFRKSVNDKPSDGNKAYIYAGFKVYPPLGFDPWPLEEEAKDQEDLERIKALQSILKKFYGYCVAYNIPIVSHCGSNEAGTEASDIAFVLTSPNRWKPVFEAFEGLKVCFAHFGLIEKSNGDIRDEWFYDIQSLMKTNDQCHIYADISCVGHKPTDYNKFIKLSEDPIIKDKVLFGTDFPLTCFETKNYHTYINALDTAGSRDEDIKYLRQICEENPYRFIFD